MKYLLKYLIIFLVVYFLFFTFFNLNWGAPFYFHPDERNIASSISQLDFPNNLNPHFFAYGQLPIYIVYFLGLVQNFFSNGFNLVTTVGFDQAIIIGRILSGVLTVALVFLIYKTTCLLKNKETGILAFILSATSVAFFQFSHFGTFEIWLSFLLLTTGFFLLKFLKTNNNTYFAISCVFFGISCGLKLSSLVFAFVPLYAIAARVVEENKLQKKITESIRFLLIFVLFACLSYFLSSPFNFIDSVSFINSMRYESAVAAGTLPVFYTGSFYDQIPILFQYTRILPFLINPIITLVSIPVILYSTYIFIKKRDKFLSLFLLSFYILFLSQSILFAKWTRYIIPAIPFLYILTAVSITNLVKNRRTFNIFILLFAAIGILFSFAFIKTTRIDQDSRISALSFAQKEILPNSPITSEVYDLGILPFNPDYKNITLFNFYDLDNGRDQRLLLPLALNTSEYIILPSQRIYESRIKNSNRFPRGSKFYSSLFSNKTNFVKVYETPCDIFCKLTYMGGPVFNVELTTNVFDRPTVYIFKKK